MVMQCLIQHLVLSKRVATLDQFSTGLETPRVLNAVRAKPAVFEALFISSTSRITPNTAKQLFRLKPSSGSCTAAAAVFNMVTKYIEESSEDGKYYVWLKEGFCKDHSTELILGRGVVSFQA